ncbi:hypothetical protein CFB84_33465 [Burkholderia aenigmatica]|uniref:Uncharacterized protein n=2 Tax=Burkholderia aenigmatica TaxID=2015348 RepID=A0A228I395_9BURK|nr:hypothetical protein CFB84_33465 [Burkholderia aenigmatica]
MKPMPFRKCIDHTDLPPTVAAAIPAESYLTAYDRSDTATLVIWVVDPSLNRQREREYSRATGAFLTVAERHALCPPNRTFAMPDGRVTVHVGYRFDPDTDVCSETYAAFDNATSALLVQSEQMCFSPAMSDPEDVVRDALRKTEFPRTYAGWIVPERIGYWVGVLYRQRRQAGESGTHEDAAFTAALAAQMKRVDPNIEWLLPSVLAELARMEMTDEHALRAAFSERTGIAI